MSVSYVGTGTHEVYVFWWAYIALQFCSIIIQYDTELRMQVSAGDTFNITATHTRIQV